MISTNSVPVDCWPWNSTEKHFRKQRSQAMNPGAQPEPKLLNQTHLDEFIGDIGPCLFYFKNLCHHWFPINCPAGNDLKVVFRIADSFAMCVPT